MMQNDIYRISFESSDLFNLVHVQAERSFQNHPRREATPVYHGKTFRFYV